MALELVIRFVGRTFFAAICLQQRKREIKYCSSKNVVAVSRHHVTRLGDINERGARQHPQELFGSLAGHHVAAPSSDQHGWHLELVHSGCHICTHPFSMCLGYPRICGPSASRIE